MVSLATAAAPAKQKVSIVKRLRNAFATIAVAAFVLPFVVSLFVLWDIDRSSWFSDELSGSSTVLVDSKLALRKPQLPAYHLVFSTSCTPQQHWESYVFFYHAKRVGQRGTVTRIASGCSEKEAADLQRFHEDYITPMSRMFELHLTPDFSRVRLSEGKHSYKYMNKPYGLRHWMEHRLKLGWNEDNTTIVTTDVDVLDGIVILLDPDMILLRPITHDFSGDHELWAEKPEKTVVMHGNPIAQQDGYLNNEWMHLNFTYITGGTTVLPPKKNSDGPLHWNTGPPYLATVSDMYKITSIWTVTAPRVLDVYPKLFAEMYGFIIATVMLNMPFALTRSIVVSTTSAPDREGWPMVDALHDDDVCTAAIAATNATPADIQAPPSSGGSSSSSRIPTLPVGLHYCKRYVLGNWFFSKYRIKKNIMDCNKNLLKLPPRDIYPTLDHVILPPRADLSDAKTYKEERSTISPKQAKREAFMLCGMSSAVNEALRHYKAQACGKDANLKEEYTVFSDPSNH